MLYVIALGGNALADGRAFGRMYDSILRLRDKGNKIILTHGNGPQVGELALLENKGLAVLTAQTEAEIGLGIENGLAAASARAGAKSPRIATVLTRVLVNPRDKEFRSPSKPIGPFMGASEARKLASRGFSVRKLIHGYRRVVPSPRPREILESGLMRLLLRDRYVVIAAGGGGIAVTRGNGRLAYANAVLDKDLTSALLATTLRADRLFILTDVDGAFLDFGTKHSALLTRTTAEALQSYASEGQFEKGSMLPKVEACLEFVQSTGRPAVIGNLQKAEDAFKFKDATVVYP
ncbi:Carbamate kinase [uncultured archaeon]|nr:Carbamate kinase [uncultured archaeon]